MTLHEWRILSMFVLKSCTSLISDFVVVDHPPSCWECRQHESGD